MDNGAYRQFCEGTPDLPLFMQPYWLDMVCPGAWQGLLHVDEHGDVDAAWAVHTRRIRSMRAIVLPPLTPFTGIWLRPPSDLKPAKKVAWRHRALSALIDQLPHCAIFEQKLQFTLQDWLPFYWRGYRQETRYTFRFPSVDTEVIEAGVSKSFRRNLRAAERQFSVDTPTDVEAFYGLLERVFEIREDSVPFDRTTVEGVFRLLHDREQCRIYQARSEDGDTSAILTIWDNTTTYYLLGGRSGSNTRSAANLLLWKALEDTAERGHAFDFEGSMIEGVNVFFQSFGAQMVPYLHIYRYNGLARGKYLFR